MWGLGYVPVGGASLLVPVYALALGADAVLVGLLAATAAFAGVPGAILAGRLARRADRHRGLVVGAVFGMALTLAGMSLVRDTLALLVLNAGLWFAVAAAAPVCNLVVVGGAAQDEWDDRLAALNAVQGWGWVLGLIAGIGWVAVATTVSPAAAHRSLLLAFAGLSAIAAVGVFWTFPAGPRPSLTRFATRIAKVGRRDLGAGRIIRLNPLGAGRLYWALRRLDLGGLTAAFRGPTGTFLLGIGAFALGSAVFWGPMPAYLDGRGLSTTAIFAVFLAANAGSAMTYGRVARLEPRFGAARLQVAGIGARSILFPAVLLGGAALWAIGGVFLAVGVSWALAVVTAPLLVARLAPPERRSGVLGTYTAVVSGGTGVGSILGGIVATAQGFAMAFAVAGVVVLAGAVLAWRGLNGD
ncbi:MAG: MFS transporter [Haloarculaceae archaeon]